MKKNQKIIAGVCSGIIIAAASIFLFFRSKKSNNNAVEEESKTEDFKVGPDGKSRYSKRGKGGQFVKKDQPQA